MRSCSERLGGAKDHRSGLSGLLFGGLHESTQFLLRFLALFFPPRYNSQGRLRPPKPHLARRAVSGGKSRFGALAKS